MIIQEIVTIDNTQFTYTYSDKNVKIKQIETNRIYDTAYDLVQYPMTYVETDELIEGEEIDNGNSED